MSNNSQVLFQFLSDYRVEKHDDKNYKITQHRIGVSETGKNKGQSFDGWYLVGYYGDLRSLAYAIVKICSINEVESNDLIDQLNELVTKFDQKLIEVEARLKEIMK